MNERESGVSPLIAEILMVALVLLAAGVAYLAIFQLPQLEKIPLVAADITKDGSLVTLFFKNGDPLEQNQFYVTVNGNRVPDGNVSLNDGVYPWTPGESILVNYTGVDPVRDVKLVYVNDPVSVVLASAFFPGPSGNITPVYTRYPGFTAEAWVKWNIPPNPGSDTTRKWATIVVDGTSDSTRRYQLQHNSDNTHFEFALVTVTLGGSGTWVTASTTPVSGTWYYVTGVYNKTPGTMAIFVNGVQESGKVVDSSGLRASPGKYQVGGPAGITFSGANQRIFDGDISGLKTYEEAFSQPEILAHYGAGVP